MSDDNDDLLSDELLEALGEILYWCFWPRRWWHWLLYVAALVTLELLKKK